jgi:hypothetical protein
MVVGWFFGIITFLFGLLLVYGSPIAGLIVMFIGVLMCYGGSRSGRGGGISNMDRYRMQYGNPNNPNNPNSYLNPNNPNNPNSFMKRYRK